MKASLKFREDQRPLIRAKVPLSILGFPFQSGVAAGDSKELTLNLSTLFESGPSIKFSYRPNDSWNPFSLIVKTGSGSFGSPISSSMIMSAEFNLISKGNPSFMLHFKPKFGDFSIKKSQSSVFDKVLKSGSVVVPEEESIEIVDAPVVNPAYFAGKEIPGFSKDSHAFNTISGFFSGMEVTASTIMPVRSHAAVNFRWGLRVPAELKNGANPTYGITFQKVPFLVLNKIGIEHVDGRDSKETIKTGTGSGLKNPRNTDLGEACVSVKREIEFLQGENGLLKKAVDDLRLQIAGINSGKYQETERNGAKQSGSNVNYRRKVKKGSELSGFDGDAASEELRKALNVASSVA